MMVLYLIAGAVVAWFAAWLFIGWFRTRRLRAISTMGEAGRRGREFAGFRGALRTLVDGASRSVERVSVALPAPPSRASRAPRGRPARRRAVRGRPGRDERHRALEPVRLAPPRDPPRRFRRGPDPVPPDRKGRVRAAGGDGPLRGRRKRRGSRRAPGHRGPRETEPPGVVLAPGRRERRRPSRASDPGVRRPRPTSPCSPGDHAGAGRAPDRGDATRRGRGRRHDGAPGRRRHHRGPRGRGSRDGRRGGVDGPSGGRRRRVGGPGG